MAPAAWKWHLGMRVCRISPYFFPYAVTIIRTIWYLMHKYGIESGNNDTKSGILTTYGIIPCNSNPSSSAKKKTTPFGVVFFFVIECGTGFEPI